MVRPKKHPCLDCKNNVEETQASVQCTICSRWIHKDCGIGDRMYELILEVTESMGSHVWSCEGCSVGLAKLNKLVQNHDREIREIRKDVDVLKSKQSDTVDLNNRVESLVTDVKDLKAMPKTDNDTVYEEIRLRESKRMNLMIFGINEPNTTLDDKAKRKLDEDVILDIFEELGYNLKMKDDIKFMSRLGKTSTRPIVVGFRSQECRDKILNNTWKLSKSEEFKDISVNPDLTPKQLEEEKKLKLEAENRNEEMAEKEPEVAKNFTWKLVGLRGQRLLRKVARGEEPVTNNYQQRSNTRTTFTRARIPSQRRVRAEMEDNDIEEENQPSQQRRKTNRMH